MKSNFSTIVVIMTYASMKKLYGVVYNMMMTWIYGLFWFGKNENGMENVRTNGADRRPPMKTMKVQHQTWRTKNVRPVAAGSSKKRSDRLDNILVEMKKENSLVVRQLLKMSSENELMKNRLVNLENSRVSNATVVSDICTANAKLFEKVNGFMEKFTQMTPTNNVKIDSTTCDDGKYNNVVYEGFDKKIEKLQMTLDSVLADKESLVRLNSNMNREIGDLKWKLDTFERNGHGKNESNYDYDSLKSDFYQMRNEMRSLKGSISTNKCLPEAEKLTRKYDKLKMRFGFIEQDVTHNSMCIQKSQQSIQDVVNIMTANRNARCRSQQIMYVDRHFREPAVYSNPPPQVYQVSEPPVIPTRPQTVISSTSLPPPPPPPPPMTSVPRPPPPPPPPPMNSTIPPPPPPPQTGKQRVYERIPITADALNAVPLKKPDGTPNKIKIRSDIVIVKKQPENPPDL